MSTTTGDVRTAGRMKRRPLLLNTRHQWSVGIVLLLALAFYLWTAASTYPFTFSHYDAAYSYDTYNLMTTGFLHGHLSLPISPPTGLLALRDPYNPTQNLQYRAQFQDLILHNGRLYSAWGPSPALLFMLVRITTFRLPTSLAVALYCFGGLVAAVGLLHALARRFIPAAPDWALTISSVAIALTNVAPFLLRRSAEYEVAIAGAYFFEMGGLWLIAAACLRGPLRHGRLAWGSLLLGLALLARPTMAVGLLPLLAVAFMFGRRREGRVVTLVTSLAPFGACLIALFVYNALRFGGPGNFGTQWQLAGLEVSRYSTEQLSYVLPGAFSYLFIPAQVSLTFPHVFLQTSAQYPFPLPSHYEGSPGMIPPEVTGGMLPTMPITIVLLGLPLVWWRWRRQERGPLLVIGGGVLLTLLVIAFLGYALPGSTQRYEVDYATLGLISALLLWSLILSRATRRWWRRPVAIVGTILIALGAGAGVAVSFTGYYNLLDLEHPGTFNTLEKITAPVATLATMIDGGPNIVRTDPAPLAAPTGSPYTQFDADGSAIALGGAEVTVEILSPKSEKTALVALAVPASAPLAGQVIEVTQPDGHHTTVPVIARSLRIPVSLGWGLNRVVLRLAHVPAADTKVMVLEDLRTEA